MAAAGRFAGRAAAAALGLAVVAGGVTALARYLFGYAVPDGFDLVRLTGGIAACWGIAAAIAADRTLEDGLWACGRGRGARRLCGLVGI